MTDEARYPNTTTGEGFDRTQHHYKELKRQFRKDCERDGLGCWLCPQPIDYSLKWPHPESFTVDHAKPVSKFPELADDPLNFRPAHLVCNQMRGDDDPHIDIGTPSEDW